MNSLILHRTISVLVRACSVLFTQIIDSFFAQTLTFNFDQYPNRITVNCQGVGTDIVFRFTRLDGTPGGICTCRSHSFFVSPETETNISCRFSNTQWSDPVTFAGEKN